MLTEHPNVTMIRALFSAFRARDIETVQAAIAADATWHFPGRMGHLAGDHVGRDAIFEFLARVPTLTNDTFRVELIDVIANDRNAVALFRGTAQRDGKTLDNPTCLRIQLEHGQIKELWEFVWDLPAVDEFWT